MKKLEDIERLSALDLERIASDETIMVPATLKRDIAITARALEMASKEDSTHGNTNTGKRLRKAFSLISYSAAAVALIVIGLHLSFQDTPKDTFDDPKMAYVQMEQVLGFISEKMNAGMDIANVAEPVFDKTINALR